MRLILIVNHSAESMEENKIEGNVRLTASDYAEKSNKANQIYRAIIDYLNIKYEVCTPIMQIDNAPKGYLTAPPAC